MQDNFSEGKPISIETIDDKAKEIDYNRLTDNFLLHHLEACCSTQL